MATIPANLPLCTHRYALIVSYIGTKYCGSQRLINRETSGQEATIQEALEVALETVVPQKRCRLTCASRTDKGVHALMNCYSLPLMDFSYPTEKVKRLVNQHLIKKQHDILVNEVLLVPAAFHPRKWCHSREYVYRIGIPRNMRSVVELPNKAMKLFHLFPAHELYRLLPLPYLNLERAEQVMNLFRGEHDFFEFSCRPSETDDTVRSMDIELVPAGHATFEQEEHSRYDLYDFHFKSRSFLHNQIRRIVGVIISYATFDCITLDKIKELLNKETKWSAKFLVAEPWGLYLSRINYDSSAFDNTLETYEDNSEEIVDMNTIRGFSSVESDDEKD